jgi:hypothetical protein
MEKSHLEQSRIWLDAAKYAVSLSDAPNAKYIVGTAMAIHAIIKANDALSFKFLNTTAHRHDDARRLFEDIIRRNLIKSEYAGNKRIIQDAINNKARAEYRISSFSKSEAEDMIRKAEKFIMMADTVI